MYNDEPTIICSCLPSDIIGALTKHRERYTKTLTVAKKIYAKQVAKYQKAYTAYTQKEFDGKLIQSDVRPSQPQSPKDRTVEYDRYIRLYKLTEKTTNDMEIDISYQMYLQFFEDELDFVRAHVGWLNKTRAGGRAGGQAMNLMFLDATDVADADTAFMAYEG
jgi:hypothetical protein